MKNIKISIIIPSYKSEKTLPLCLNSILNQKTDLRYEIIVVDSSPTKKVNKIIKKYPKIKFIKLKNQTFPGTARNIGAKKAEGKLLVFIDSDIIIKKDTLQKISYFYKKGYKIFDGAIKLANYPKFKLVSALEHSYFNHEFQERNKIKKRKNLSSAFMVIEKKIFLENNGFKEIPRMQDTEFTERLYKKGIDMYLIPKIVSHQIHNSDLKKLIKKVFINGNNIYFIRGKNKNNIFIKIILILILPVLTLAKLTRINLRNMIYNDLKGNMLGLFLSPAMYFLGLFWMLGMYRAVISDKGIIKSR